jgi:hypothetical protein
MLFVIAIPAGAIFNSPAIHILEEVRQETGLRDNIPEKTKAN